MWQDDPEDLKLKQLQFLCCKSAFAAGSGTTFSSHLKQLYRPCSSAAWRSSSLHPSQLLLRCQYRGKYNFRLPLAQSPSGLQSLFLSPHTKQRQPALCLCPSGKPELYGKHCLVLGRCSFLHPDSFTLTLPGQGNVQELALSLSQF